MKKNWNNPELKNLVINETNTEEDCSENKQGDVTPACLCPHYHAKMFGGCGGCSAPDYKCVLTGCKPLFTKKCECGSSNVNPS